MTTEPMTGKIERIAESLLTGGLCLGLFSFLGSLPPFRIGLWDTSDPIILWMLTSAVVAGLGLALHPKAAGTLRNPVVLAPLALAAWSALASPFADLPLLSILGSHQTSQGSLWYLALAILSAAALMVARNQAPLRISASLALTALVLLAALLAASRLLKTHLLYDIPSFHVYLALPLPLLAWALKPPGKNAARTLGLCALVLGLGLLGLTANRTAMIAVLAGGGLFWMAPWVLSRRWALWGAIAAAMLLPLAVGAWLAPVLGVESLMSRHYLAEVAWSTLTAEPRAWISGLGWGSTPHTLGTHLLAAQVSLVDQTKWDLFHREYHHFHNWILENLIAAGLPGLLLSAGVTLAPLLGAPPSRRRAALTYVVTLLILDGFWFQEAFFLPMQAFAAGLLAEGGTWTAPPMWPRLARLAPAGIAASAALLAGAAAWQGWYVIGHERERQAMWEGSDPEGTAALALVVDDPRQDALVFAVTARTSLDYLDLSWNKTGALDRIGGQAAALERIVPTTFSPLPAMTCLNLFDRTLKAAPDSPELPALLARRSLWGVCVKRLIELAPERTDRLIPWMTRLMVEGRSEELSALADRLLSYKADDPLALYFKGAALTFDPDPARKRQGLGMIGQAIDGGLERFMPVDQQLKSMVGRF